MPRQRRVVSYQAALDWMAANDDTSWLDDDDPIISVTAVLVADLFGRENEEVIADLRRTIKKMER